MKKKLLISTTLVAFSFLTFWGCEKYYEDTNSISSTSLKFDDNEIQQEIQQKVLTPWTGTCITDLLPYSYDFQDTGTILIGFISDKPEFTASIWSFDPNTVYFLDSTNDTIHLENGNIWFEASNEFGTTPTSITINNTTYTSQDTIWLGNSIDIWKVCVNPLAD